MSDSLLLDAAELARVAGDAALRYFRTGVAVEAKRPIDGAKTFVRGVLLWGTLVALHEGERVLGGAIYRPSVGELVVAAPGRDAGGTGAGAPYRT